MHPDITLAIEKIQTSKWQLFLQIIFVFIAPIALIFFDVVSISTRVPVLVVVVGLLVFILYKEKWTLGMFGVRKHINNHAVIAYAVFTIAGVIAIVSLGERIGHEEIARWWTHSHFVYLFFVVSLFQEIAYRGYLIPALGKLAHSTAMVIFVNTLLFTYLHVIFPDHLVGLPLAFIGGIGFAVMYIKYPSLPLIVLSHAILNFVAVLYGFFVIPGITY